MSDMDNLAAVLANGEPTRFARVKNHIKENKPIYIGAAVGVAGLVGGAFMSRRNLAVVDSFNVKVNSPTTTTLTQVVELIRRGHPGKVLRCIETGELFASQNRAAAALNVTPAAISKYLNGVVPNAQGYTFEYLGDAQ